MKTYAGYYKNKIREKSSSGGIFSALANCILKKNGVVYGVCMSSDNYSAHFERASTYSEVQLMIGSKYMQASMGSILHSVKMDLENGIVVLFTGTICQINGLKKYLQRDYDNLYCADVICHGVPSQKLWKKYILSREEQIGKCIELNFRSKEAGWYASGIKENYFFTSQNKNQYMNLFLSDLCLRPSCYECICKKNKKSDITIGDLWGVHQVAPDLDDDRGISAIILRTKKSENMFNCIKGDLVYKEITYDEAILENPSEHESAQKPLGRETFYRDLEKKSFESLWEKYMEKTLVWKFYGGVKRKFHRILLVCSRSERK